MSVLVVGSTALDSIKTPKAENPCLLGGSGSHAAVAASFFSPVRLVGIVGKDFPKRYIELFRKHGIDLAGLQIAEGKTFHWSGEYEINMNNRRTLSTEMGVLGDFKPDLPKSYLKTPFVLLANNAPALQHYVLDQMEKPHFVVADTMDLWLNIALKDLLRLLKRVDALVLNDSEAKQLANDDNLITAAAKIHRLGPQFVIIKKGEHGSLLSTPQGFFMAPAYPLKKVVDPTGAGDSFVGGMLGYLASQKGSIEKNLRKAVVCGTVVASFCCEGFGLNQTNKTTLSDVKRRLAEFEKMVRY